MLVSYVFFIETSGNAWASEKHMSPKSKVGWRGKTNIQHVLHIGYLTYMEDRTSKLPCKRNALMRASLSFTSQTPLTDLSPSLCTIHPSIASQLDIRGNWMWDQRRIRRGCLRSR